MRPSLIAQTTPGLQNVGSSTQTVWGVRYATEYSQDGSLLQDKYLQGMVDRPPALESVDELVATTNAASAKLSRPAVITMSTRAGTNNTDTTGDHNSSGHNNQTSRDHYDNRTADNYYSCSRTASRHV